MVSTILKCHLGSLARAAVAIVAAVCVFAHTAPTSALAAEPEVLLPRSTYTIEPPQAAPQAAGQGAKYSKLLKVLTVEDDRPVYGDFYDFGYWNGTEWKDNKDLPAGYWVYVAPHWYIFSEQAGSSAPQQVAAKPIATVNYIQLQTAAVAGQKRPWGPEQAVGPPDTHLAGDIQTAWASQTPDGQDEWLRLHYAKAVVPAAVQVYETFNPGALYRITARKADGSEVELWSGDDPVKPDAGMGMACIPVKADFATDCITIYLKSTKVPGWNEIDAVGLVDQQNNLQWAASAEASSTFADATGAVEYPYGPSADVRITNLEAQVRQLSTEVEELKRKLDQRQDR